MQQPFYDEFNIDEKFQELRKLMKLLEQNVYKFISPTKNRLASVRARKNLQEIRAKSLELRKAITKQRDHNDSQY